VEIDGTIALSYHGSLIDEEGAIGLYTEDARVRVREVQLIRF
jgi:hypothetical protein